VLLSDEISTNIHKYTGKILPISAGQIKNAFSLSLSLSLSLWLCIPFVLGRFFSFLILHTVGGPPWTGDQPVARPLHTHNTYRTNAHTDIHASSGIRTNDPSVRVGEDISCLRPRRHCDRLKMHFPLQNL
jgi:hypothetical protein